MQCADVREQMFEAVMNELQTMIYDNGNYDKDLYSNSEALLELWRKNYLEPLKANGQLSDYAVEVLSQDIGMELDRLVIEAFESGYKTAQGMKTAQEVVDYAE